MIRLRVVGYVCFLVFASKASGQCPHEIDSLVRHSVFYEESEKDLRVLYKNPNCSIPLLLSCFSDTTTVFVGCIDSLSSLLPNGHMSYVGIKAALIIEWLLSDAMNDYRLCGKTPCCFMMGFVVKNDQILESLSFDDIKEIERKYFGFWKDHENDDIGSLRKKFIRFKTVLLGTNYMWR